MGGRGAKSCAAVIGALLLALSSLAGCSGDTTSATASSQAAAATVKNTVPGTGGPTGVVTTGELATDLPIAVDASQPTAPAAFDVVGGTEEVTVTGLQTGQRVSLVDAQQRRLMILKADKFGQAHFSYLPFELGELQSGAKAKIPVADGYIVIPGAGYTVRLEDTDPVQVTQPFTVLGRDDHPAPGWYQSQVGKIGPSGSATQWFGYVTMRDGVQLSVTVRLPGPVAKGPYPTVLEYSGYGVSNPDATEPGSMIAGLLGYATVGINMRGTGCSGGVFDVFNTAQQVDGYDAVEAIARQPWVKGNKVGMVGLSYSGISQLYVAATQPPSLAAITPLSVIKDPWLEQWPGGVYNGGFTRRWLSERDSQASANGFSWVDKRIKGGDQTCAAVQDLREQNLDFEYFGRSLVHRSVMADGRDLSKLVAKIKVPVYLSGAFQDEQTGPQFGDMLGNFTGTKVHKFTLMNGRHPDGYTPQILTRWFEFLELYVNQKVPRISDGFRQVAPAFFEDSFGTPGLTFEPDRFTAYADTDLAGVRKAFEATPDVRVLFERGMGGEVPGAPVSTFEKSYRAWPAPGLNTSDFFLAGKGTLAKTSVKSTGIDRFANDPTDGEVHSTKEGGAGLLEPTWDFDWKLPGAGKGLSYVSKPFTRTTVLSGPGYADLYLRVPDGDADVQVTVSLIRPDNTEWHVTSGLLRLSDRKVDAKRSKGLRIERTFTKEDSSPMPAGGFRSAKVSLPTFAQVFRPGDRLRIIVASPGRDFAEWAFTTIGDAGTPRDVAWGGSRSSKIVLGVLPGITSVPDLNAPCPSLRGQACRTYTAVSNPPAP